MADGASKLQQKLAEWRKRQVELQAQAAKDAASNKAMKRESKPRVPKAPKAGAVAGKAGASPANKQKARKEPLNKLLKTIIDHLQQTRQPATSAQLLKETGVQLEGDEELLGALRASQKIDVDGDKIAYKALHDLQNKEELWRLLLKGPEGTHYADVKDAYADVVADVEALRREGRVWVMPSPVLQNRQDAVLFPRDPRLDMAVDPDVAQLWHKAEIPADLAELEAELRKAGYEPGARSEVRKRPAVVQTKEKKKRQQSRPRVVTNVHMPELFLDPEPQQID